MKATVASCKHTVKVRRRRA